MAPMLFTKAIIENMPIKVFNHGDMQRDFTYVDDIVDGIIKSILTSKGNRIFNLGNNNPIQLEYFISCIEKELNMKAKKEYLDMQAGDMKITYADIEHTTRELSWKPIMSIEYAIKLLVQWYKEFYKK